MAAPTPVELVFEKERDTKNKVRFQENVAKGKKPVVDKLYVDKEVLAKMGDPEILNVTIAAP